jgi:hypothetical protein
MFMNRKQMVAPVDYPLLGNEGGFPIGALGIKAAFVSGEETAITLHDYGPVSNCA